MPEPGPVGGGPVAGDTGPAAGDTGPAARNTGSTAALARFAATLTFEAIPGPVIDQARRLLLDTAGCIVAGGASHAGRLVLAWIAESGCGGRASILGSDADPTTPALAAYGNARLAAVHDADDTFPSARQLSHHGAATVAAALAIAEARGLDGRALLTAIVAGYEVGARVSSSMVRHPGPGERGLRAGWGPGGQLAAAAAAANALGLDPEATAHALGIAGMHVGPGALQWTEDRPGPMFKSADGGWHAVAGITGATQAAIGLTGYATILDGERGLFRALGYDACDHEALRLGLGDRWLTLDSSFKAWPCQYWMHQALTALAQVLEAHDLPAEEIDEITLFTNERSTAARFRDPDPPTEIDLAFSFPHAASMLVLGVPGGPRWFRESWAEDRRARRLRHLVRIEPEPEADRYREWVVDHVIRDMPARAIVRVGDRRFESTARLGRGSPWSPETRLGDAQLESKFRELAGSPSPEGGETRRLDDALEWIRRADRMASVDGLVGALRRGSPGA